MKQLSTRAIQLAVIGFLLTGLYLGVLQPLFAQSPVSAAVDRDVLTVGEQLILELTVENGSDEYPVLPDLEGAGFQVSATSRQTSQAVINGVIYSEEVYAYALRPKQEGLLEIGSFEVAAGGQIYYTDPIVVEVLPGNYDDDGFAIAPEKLGEAEFFIEADVDNDTPYRGQQVEYIVRFYWQAGSSERISEPELPEFVGFWKHTGDDRRFDTVFVDGTEYLVVEFSYYLFPTKAGELTIEPTTIRTELGRAFVTEGIVVNVKDLPEPAPDGFGGAVGQYQLTTMVDSNAINSDESVNVSVSLLGVGNIEYAPEVKWPDSAEWRFFEQNREVNIKRINGEVGGERLIQWSATPNTGGFLTLPNLEYVYFDPISEQYVTASPDPIEIVVQGDVVALPTDEPEETPAPDEAAEEEIATLDIVQDPPNFGKPSVPISDAKWLPALWVIPFLLCLAGIGLFWSKRPKSKKAIDGQSDLVDLSPTDQETTRQYLDRLLPTVLPNFKTGSLNQIETQLQTAKFPPEFIEQGLQLYRNSDAIQYAGDTLDPVQLKKEAIAWIKQVK